MARGQTYALLAALLAEVLCIACAQVTLTSQRYGVTLFVEGLGCILAVVAVVGTVILCRLRPLDYVLVAIIVVIACAGALDVARRIGM